VLYSECCTGDWVKSSTQMLSVSSEKLKSPAVKKGSKDLISSGKKRK